MSYSSHHQSTALSPTPSLSHSGYYSSSLQFHTKVAYHLVQRISNGSDLRFFAQDGTQLSYEIEVSWSNSPSATNWVWVKVPSIDDATNTTFRMYHGNTGTVTAAPAATSVWDSNFKLIQHFEETSGSATDSTTNSNTGTAYLGLVQGTSSQIGGGIQLDGSNDYMQFDDSDTIDYAAGQDFTVSAWVNANTTQVNTTWTDNMIIEKWSGSGGYPYVLRYINQTHATPDTFKGVRYDGTNAPADSSTSGVGNAYRLLTLTKNGSTLEMFVDGVSQGGFTDTTTGTTTNASPLYLGRRGGATG